MPPVQVTKLFPDDTFYPEMFSLEERRYLRDHIGQKPSVMQADPPPHGVDASGIATLHVALTRMFDDPHIDRLQEEIAFSIDRSFRIYERKQQAKERHPQRLAPMQQLGVGQGAGQSWFDRTGGVRLSPMHSVDGEVFADLLNEDEKQGIVTSAQSLRESFRLECGFCPDDDRFHQVGKSCYMSVGAHVRKVHPEHKKSWDSVKTQIKRLQNEGDQRIVIVTPDGLDFRARPRVQ